MSDVDDLARRFQRLELSRAQWTHDAHLAVGLWHVARFGPGEALERLRCGIRALNEHNGVVNSRTEGYHETITRGYVELIAGFLSRRGVAVPTNEALDADVDALLHDPLARRDALLAYWSRERLLSAQARAA